MKKPITPKNQLEIFKSKNEALEPKSIVESQSVPQAKQVFFDPRQRIYEKILNRKME